MDINWKRIAVDVLIIIALSSIGGALGMLVALKLHIGLALGLLFALLVPLVCQVFGFTYISLRVNNRWSYLLVVAIVAWLLMSVLMPMIAVYRFPEATLVETMIASMGSLGTVLVVMALGRAAGVYIQNRRTPKS